MSFHDCHSSVDVTNYLVQEPMPFIEKCYSHRLKYAGLRYKVGISIFGGKIVWVIGQFMCGSFTNLNIFETDLLRHVDSSERFGPDSGYENDICTRHQTLDCARDYVILQTILARQENFNSRLKRLKSL